MHKGSTRNLHDGSQLGFEFFSFQESGREGFAVRPTCRVLGLELESRSVEE